VALVDNLFYKCHKKLLLGKLVDRESIYLLVLLCTNANFDKWGTLLLLRVYSTSTDIDTRMTSAETSSNPNQCRYGNAFPYSQTGSW